MLVKPGEVRLAHGVVKYVQVKLKRSFRSIDLEDEPEAGSEVI
jgi:hypothetical protein